jgi:hypothetical protein
VPGKPPAHWRTRSTAIGPIYLYSVREWAASPRADFAPLPGTHGKRFPGAKQLIVVRGGGVATLSIALEDRAVASLMYDNIPFDHGYAVADGDPSVTFSDCATPATHWAGAFVVAGARCVTLLVNDATGRRVAAHRIAFGVRGCARKAARLSPLLGGRVSGSQQRRAVSARARELLKYARQQGYRREELIAMIERLD